MTAVSSISLPRVQRIIFPWRKAMSIRNALAGVAVKDLKAATAWYGKLIGREPDTRPMSEVVEWQFSTGGWLQVFEDKKRAGSSSVTFVENDFNARLNDLKAATFRVESLTQSDIINVAIIHDPDGNQIVFAQGKGEKHRAVS
jgi:hypothetical protein